MYLELLSRQTRPPSKSDIYLYSNIICTLETQSAIINALHKLYSLHPHFLKDKLRLPLNDPSSRQIRKSKGFTPLYLNFKLKIY